MGMCRCSRHYSCRPLLEPPRGCSDNIRRILSLILRSRFHGASFKLLKYLKHETCDLKLLAAM